MFTMRRFFGSLLALGLLALFFLVEAVPHTYADEPWRAKYWNNKNLAGDPVLDRKESEINYDWGDGSPSGVHDDNFSARWKRTLNVPAGTYRFTATMDDGMRVWVDNNLLIDSWINSQVRTIAANTYLSTGDHEIKVEYYEDGGEAVAKLRIDPTGGAAISNWRGEYFNNRSLSGTPALIRDDERIDFDWGGGSPAWGTIGADNFSVRWTRAVNLQSGRYRWTTTTDDGVRLWVNGRLLIDKWFDQSANSYSAETDLSGGLTEVRMEYYENGGGAMARLQREQISGSVSSGGWRGEYFNNRNLSGSPALVRNDSQVDFNWGTGAPAAGISADDFSVRWTRTVDLQTGRYRWTTTTDDGVRLWVNGRLLIDKWFDQSATTYSAESDITGGLTEVRMEYYEHEGGAEARLRREPIGSSANSGPWRGEYFNNKKLSGSPALVRDDRNIDFNWGNGSPAAGINSDNFSVRWTRSQYLAPGRHRFTAVTDDGVRLWVNGQQIINDWVDRKPSTSVGEITLPGGNYTIKMEYYENAGGARANLTRMQIATTPAPAPTPAAPTGTVPGVRLNMRSGPGISNSIIRVLGQGETVTLMGRNGLATWVKVGASNNVEGWVYASLLQMNVAAASLPVVSGEVNQPALPAGQTATVANAIYALNVRSGPGTTYDAISAVMRGQTVELLGRNGDSSWLNIRTPGGTVGWSSARYLDTTFPLSSLPVNG